MNRTDVVRMVANRIGVSQVKVTKVLDGLLEVVEDTVGYGEHVNLKGFGKFYLQRRRPRSQPVPLQRGVKTIRHVEIGERNTIAFAPSRALRARLNGEPSPGSNDSADDEDDEP